MIEVMEMKVERMRREMYRLYCQDPASSQVLAASQALDRALNELEKLKQHFPPDIPAE